MASRYKDKDTGSVVFSFNGKWISWAHTTAAYSKLAACRISPLGDLEILDIRHWTTTSDRIVNRNSE